MNSTNAISTRLPVRSPDGEYEIVLGHDVLDSLGELAAQVGLGRRVVVATDTHVAPLYGLRVISALQESGFRASLVATPAGEQHKHWQSVSLLVDAFLDAGLDRSSWVAALGGGVVGDTVGFAASVYMRGISLVQVPTTLLAMADSSIGGKVGVDHPRGKNLLGAFMQPRLVAADLNTLASLPPEQIACGIAEIIKAGVIGDPSLFDLLERHDPGSIDYETALQRAVLVKRGIVERDPHETGERALLNLGHTFGHAFERCSGYTRLHGYAVSQGISVALHLAVILGGCEHQTKSRVERVLEKWNLPLHWGAPGLTQESAVELVWEAMMLDKKRRDGKLRLVLPQAIGSVRLVDDIPEAAIRRALVELQ